MTITAQALFAQSGGKLIVAASLAQAAYHLAASEVTGDGINVRSSAGDAAFAELSGKLQFLTSADMPSLVAAASANPNFPSNGLSDGVYIHGNASAIAGRSTDALFVSFRGTNDTAGVGNVVFGTPDNNHWSDPAAHYAEFAPFISAIDAYVGNAANGITKVYVTGHSLGGAMAQEFMRSHSGSLYEAVTFASIGSDLPGGTDAPDTRQTNIWFNNDIARIRFAASHEDLGDINFTDTGLGVLNAGNIHDMRFYSELTRYLEANGVTLSSLQDQNGLNIDSLILKVSDFRPADGVFAFGANDDVLIGTSVAEFLVGGAGHDTLTGDDGQDHLIGGTGSDRLIGGRHADTLNGGEGADYFDFNAIKESGRRASMRDTIEDMQRGIDHIDLKGIDARSGAGNQAFKWIGKKAFTDHKGELHIVKKSGFVVVEGDINGDGRADFRIEVDNVTSLSRGDFVL